MSRNWIIAGIAAVCLIMGIVLSHLTEPGVRVQKVTLAEETPALEFIPAGPAPHPVALLAHGYAGSKETLFRYGEALAAAGFVCYSLDLPGHGASPRAATYMEILHTEEAVAREVGPVDVFVGHSMGGFTGGEAVKEGRMTPGLFIALGSLPVLGDQAGGRADLPVRLAGEHAPRLLLLAGRYDEAITPALLKTRTDARVVVSPWCDHLLEAFDPVLVNAAVEAACATVHKTPPPPPTAWRWRLVGAVLAIVAAGALASCLTDLFPRLARVRGLLIGIFIAVAFMLTFSGRWLDATPHLRLQTVAIVVTFLLAMIAGRLRIPRWTFAALGVLVLVIAVCWLQARPGWPAFVLVICTFILEPALIAGIVFGYLAARRGSRLQGDIAMAIIVGFTAFQCLQPPRKAPDVPKPHVAIKLDTTLLDACVGQYEFPPDNRLWTGLKLTIWRQGDQLFGQGNFWSMGENVFKMYPESETDFFLTPRNPHVFTFVKNAKGLVTGATWHFPGSPVSVGKKISELAK